MRFIEKSINILVAGVDFLIASILFYLLLIILGVLSYCPRRKKNSFNSNTILFICSGKPIKPANFTDKKYQDEWHRYFQKQFLSFKNSKAYIYYSFVSPQEIYKITRNVIGINFPQFKARGVLQRTIKTLNFWRDYIFIKGLLKRHRIFAVACYAPSDRLLLGGILKQFLGIRLYASVMGSGDLVWSEHPYQHKKIKKLLLQIYEKIIAFFFFQKADLVIAYNNHCGDYALCNGAAPEKIRRTRIYPCIEYFDKNKVLKKEDLEGFPKTKKVVIMWSRLSYEKKIPFALEGAIDALEKDKDLGLCVIGYGPMYNDIKSIIDESRVKDRISLIGYTPSFRLLSYIYYSDVALIPLGGFSMLEACVLKKAIVCFDIEWHHELLTDGYSGYFADYPNKKQICEQILLALHNPMEAQKRGERAYKRYKLLFDKEKIYNRENQIMEEFFDKIE